MVSIHSAEEEQFVAKLASPLLFQCQRNDSVCKQRIPHTNDGKKSLDEIMRSFYMGLNRIALVPE